MARKNTGDAYDTKSSARETQLRPRWSDAEVDDIIRDLSRKRYFGISVAVAWTFVLTTWYLGNLGPMLTRLGQMLTQP